MDKREKLADYAHEAWSGWMEYLFKKCDFKHGYCTIPQWAVERWSMQMNTKYKDLPEEMKESDRDEADKMLKIMEGNTLKWNKIKDNLPKHENDVLCIVQKFSERNPYYIILGCENGIWYEENGDKFEDNPDYYYITHWAELPKLEWAVCLKKVLGETK